MAKLIPALPATAALAASPPVQADPAPLRTGVNFGRTRSISSHGQLARGDVVRPYPGIFDAA